jgi:hypothetical protein
MLCCRSSRCTVGVNQSFERVTLHDFSIAKRGFDHLGNLQEGAAAIQERCDSNLVRSIQYARSGATFAASGKRQR